MDKILSVTDVAAVLKVKEATVREMFRTQRLRAFKVGKSWRTTEPMLAEDIATLARGEMPPPLPEAARGPASIPNGKRRGRPKTKRPEAANAPAPRPPEITPPRTVESMAIARKTGDESQGLLF
jgi:excisionase family DNA binding protein